MNKILVNVAILLLLCNAVYAQKDGYRKLRPDEIAYINALHAAMYKATPHTYKNWTIVGDQEQFDARRFWCGDMVDGQDCIGDCPIILGKADPYTFSFNADYTMPDNESGNLAATSMTMIKDFSNASQLAAAQKFTASSKMRINIVINSPNIEFGFSYCAKNPLETLTLPVPSTLAVIGPRTIDCPIMEDGRPSMHADYYDRALIVLGKPATKKAPEKTSDGLTTVRYVPTFDKAKIGKLVTQNITVEIKGDANDIRALVQLIDWKKLADLLEK